MFDGTWELPSDYGDPADEYDSLRAPGRAGVADRAWRAVLRLTGADRRAFMHGMVSQDISGLADGQGRRAALLDNTAHILADSWVYALPDALLLAADPRRIGVVAQTLEKYLIMEDVEIADASSEWACLSLLGGGAEALLPSGHSAFPAAVGSVTGYDLWLPVTDAPAVWERLIQDGATPVGEAALETVRVEEGIPVWGQELDEHVLLPEAGMGDAVSYTKGCYVGQEIVARLQARGHVNRSLRRILLDHAAPVPPPSSRLHIPEDGPEPGREVGRITSAVLSPQFNGRALALGYVRREYSEAGTPLSVQISQPDGAVFAYRADVV